MLRIVPLLHEDRAAVEVSETGPRSVVIEHVFVSRSRTFAADRVNDVLLAAFMNVAPGQSRHLDLTDTLQQLFGDEGLIKDLVWIAFVLERNPAGQPAPACLAVEVLDGKITRFEPFSPPN